MEKAFITAIEIEQWGWSRNESELLAKRINLHHAERLKARPMVFGRVFEGEEIPLVWDADMCVSGSDTHCAVLDDVRRLPGK